MHDTSVADGRQTVRIAIFYVILVAMGATGILHLYNQPPLQFRTTPILNRILLPDRPLQWIPFSAEALNAGLRDRRTVLVFFHADWDVTGQALLKGVIDTPDFRRTVSSLGVTTLDADITDGHHTAALRSLNTQGAIPLLAIYPAASPTNLIVLTGWIEAEDLIELTEQASKS